MFEGNWLTLWALNVNYTTVELSVGDEIVVRRGEGAARECAGGEGAAGRTSVLV